MSVALHRTADVTLDGYTTGDGFRVEPCYPRQRRDSGRFCSRRDGWNVYGPGLYHLGEWVDTLGEARRLIAAALNHSEPSPEAGGTSSKERDA